MESFIIKPWMGIKSNVPPNCPTLLEMVGDNVGIAHCVDGMNIDFQKTRHACTKASGKGQWSNSGIGNNLVPNGDMYADANWDDVGTPSTNERSDVQVNTGTYSRKFTIDAESEGIKSDTFSLTEGETTYVSLYVYPDDATGVFVGIVNGGGIGWDYQNTFTGLTENAWNLIQFTQVVNETGSSSRIYIAGNVGESAGSWYVDSVVAYSGSDPVKCLGIYYLDDGSNTSRWHISGDTAGGRIYRYDSARDPERISDVAGHSGAVEFANSDMDLYSIIRVGTHMVFSDYGETTPYGADHNDAILIKLINAGTEYKAKYLEYFARRILMANVTSGITVGDISLIWSGADATLGSCTFATGDPPANHLYKEDDDTITGIKKMGRNSCYLYGENSIDAIDYYPNYATPFGLRSVVTGQGAYNNASIVNVGGRHHFFNRNYGFCIFDGSSNFPAGGKPISYNIEDKIATINTDYAGWINGVFLPYTNEIAWAVPLYGNSTPNHVLYYHVFDGNWRISDLAAYFLDFHPIATDVTWTKLTTDLGYSTWEDLGNLRWADLVETNDKLVFANNDGQLYYSGTEADNGSAFDGYRVEPVLDFGRPNDKDLLLEIWFDFAEVGDYSLYCYHRSGNTVGEVKAAVWTALTELSCDDPNNPIFRLAESGRYHQIKWGTDGANEPFSVSSIEFKYSPQGRY